MNLCSTKIWFYTGVDTCIENKATQYLSIKSTFAVLIYPKQNVVISGENIILIIKRHAVDIISLKDMWFEGKQGRHFTQCIIPEKLNRKIEIILPAEN